MSEENKTPLSDRADILAELWIQYKDDDDFRDFIEYNDLGLPLAYAVSHGIVEMNDQLELFVNESFDLLLSGLGIEDIGFTDLPEVLQTDGTE
jgi:hypothetical protein